jgi:sterol desaturase/sphingolipid hydroxylase (fatty acid hydroxylase superfamily)
MEEDVELKFGKGLLSGYLSVVLGIASLCGVLCFRFPQLLTSEEFRAAYTVDFVRTTLFITLVIAYIMGIISYVLNQTKTLVWIGICSAFTASLLGGSRIEIQAYDSTAYSLGLQTFIRSIPIWGQFLIAVFLADLFQHWTHRAHHKSVMLWKFHSIHHSSHAMDWLAGSRTHLVEIFITRAMVMVPLYVCGLSEAALNSYVILVGVQAVAIHANLGINFSPLRYILATPQFHHWHHAKDADYVDANYAVHLPLIDMMFGTYRCPKGKWPDEYGIVSGEPPPSFWNKLLHPFRRPKRKDDS